MPNRPRTFRYRVYKGLLLFAVLVIMGTSVLSLRTTGELQQSVVRASQTQQVLEQVNRFWGVLGDSDSHALRYLLTGHEDFLLNYRLKVDEMGAAIAFLSDISQESPVQADRVARLQALHLERAAYLGTSLQLKSDAMRGRPGAERAVRERVNSGEGFRMLVEMRGVIGEMIVEENAQLALRSQQRNQMIQQNWATVLIANSLALVAGLVGYSATQRMQRKAQEAFRAELHAEQAKRSSQDKSVFLASMSHEIRTPMNAIFGFTNLLEERVTDPTEAEYVASIKKSGQALLSLINDVLDLSKMEAGKFELREEPTSLQEIVDQTLTMFRQTAEAKGIYLRAEYEGRAELPLLVDPVRLRQVLINLVGNAIKYTDNGGVEVRICCIPSDVDGHCDLKIEVVDSGTGIAPHQLGIIFDPFQQGENPDGKSREGTGLGLSIARRLATMMGGELSAESEIGKGSRFRMSVPRRAIHIAPVSQDPPAASTVDFNRLPPLEVLVVDDVAWNRDLAKAYLAGSHHRVREAADGVEAVEGALEQVPDVVLMDLRMPRMSGEQALLKLKSAPEVAQVPVIAVTASTMGSEESLLRRRFDGYVRKPYSKQDLFEALSAHFPVEPAAEVAEVAPVEAPSETLGSAPGRQDLAALEELRELVTVDLPRVRQRLRMREVDGLSARLAALAQALEWEELRAHAADMSAAVGRFDVPAVKRLLDHVPEPGDPT
jgi:signal transduction histidine kinase/DNA-binding response OmpR family regulator